MSSEPTIRLSEQAPETPAAPGSTSSVWVDVERRVPTAEGYETRVDTFELRPANPLNLLGVFREIYFHHDPTFGFRNFECGRGICSTCNVTYKGRVQKGCRIPVPAGSRIRIATQNPARTLRDMACVVGDEADSEEDE